MARSFSIFTSSNSCSIISRSFTSTFNAAFTTSSSSTANWTLFSTAVFFLIAFLMEGCGFLTDNSFFSTVFTLDKSFAQTCTMSLINSLWEITVVKFLFDLSFLTDFDLGF